MKENIHFSTHNINDDVTLDFDQAGIIKNCKVIAITFTNEDTMYDLVIETHAGVHTQIFNVHSEFVKKIKEEQKIKSNLSENDIEEIKIFSLSLLNEKK